MDRPLARGRYGLLAFGALIQLAQCVQQCSFSLSIKLTHGVRASPSTFFVMLTVKTLNVQIQYEQRSAWLCFQYTMRILYAQ